MIRDFFNGLVFGVTQIVPGVSGGTVAIIMGFYDRLISSINNFRKEPRRSLKFLLPLAIGLVFGVLLFGSLINLLLTYFSLPTMLFFIGLIAGIIPLIYSKVKVPLAEVRLKNVMLVALPIAVLILISLVKPDEAANPAEMMGSVSWPYVLLLFLAGFLAAAGLIVPGVSGSFILLLMGVYPLATYTISQIGVWLSDVSNTGLLLDILRVAVPLGIGVVIGGLSTARLIGHLLDNHARTIYSVILGLMIGSVFALFNEPIVFQSRMSALMWGSGVAALGLGAWISYKLGRKKL
ncbi:DUF368 domain-containing protein [Candidatus Saccharibacteria bacterium]|nr:DUF368 domain-containing protein [Candidatus Saccharibacteria bacterium]